MNLVIYFDNCSVWFWVAFGTAMILGWLMGRLGKQLRTNDGSLREFSVMDLEFPSNPLDIPNIIKGIYRLPDTAEQPRVIKALKNILYLDFLFMPTIYGAIFFICMLVAMRLDAFPIEQGFFASLAWLQLLAWVFDIVETIYLLKCLRPEITPLSKGTHTAYVRIVWAKWALALIGGVSALMMLIYFWLSGS